MIGSRGIVIPDLLKIHVFIEFQKFLVILQFTNKCNKVSSSRLHSPHFWFSAIPILNCNSLVPSILWINLYWNQINLLSGTVGKQILNMLFQFGSDNTKSRSWFYLGAALIWVGVSFLKFYKGLYCLFCFLRGVSGIRVL